MFSKEKISKKIKIKFFQRKTEFTPKTEDRNKKYFN